ncbi:MAG: DNA-directed RNA polymerase subunit omega [Nitrospira sp.]|nr:DNA-directed RNA polymerase subunit omega [Nitrospira sp.]
MEIVSLPVVFNKSKIDSRFRMVILATERAKQIINGAKPTIQSRYLKSTTTALEELSISNVNYVTGKEARKALQEAVAHKIAQEIKTVAETGIEDEIKKEIEKDLGIYVPEEGLDESSDE